MMNVIFSKWDDVIVSRIKSYQLCARERRHCSKFALENDSAAKVCARERRHCSKSEFNTRSKQA